ncbi:MAG: TonB-dependent receptor [Bryobacteraceae bacterium]
MSTRRHRAACAAAILFFFAGTLSAQSTGSIQGSVTDSSSAVVPNAKVTITNQGTGETYAAKTDAAGLYAITSLTPGRYKVEVQAQGFQPVVAQDLALQVSSTVRQDFTLRVASSSTILEVTAAPPAIDTSSVTVGQVIDSRTVQEIPLNGRHFTDLALLVAGTVTPPQNGFLSAPLRGQGSFGVNSAGNREDVTNFLVNGINLNDISQNQLTFQPSINTVDEFKMDNSTYPAQYGRNSGAIVNIATRAGTNDFHGELFEYFRNSDMDARNYFNPTPILQSPFKRNNFGASTGGPFWKNHTFFFFSYEALRQRQGLTINQTVLSPAQRAQAAATSDPVINKLISYIPLPNEPGSKFAGSATAPVNIDQGTANISHQFSEKDRVNGYYALQHDLRQEPTLQGDNIPGFGDTRASHRQIFTFNESHVFNPTTVNEFRLGYNRIFITFDPNFTTSAASLGIDTGPTAAATAIPYIQINDIGLHLGGPNLFPQGRGDYTAVASDSLNKVVGRHNITFGGEYRRSNNNNFQVDPGTFMFNTLSDFLADKAISFTLSPAGPSRIYINALGFFIQDNFKATSRLTLTLGMRYDWNGTPTEARNRFANFDPATDEMVQVSQPYAQNAKNFEPRLGFAFDLFGNQKTIVRSAYAIQADQPIANLVSGLSSNPPFASPISFVGNATKGTYISLLNAANEAAAVPSLSPSAVNANFRNPYVQQWNFNIEQQLGNSLGLTAGYFGNKGTHLRLTQNLNQFVNGVRPYPRLSPDSPIDPGVALSNILAYESDGNSSYNALWVTATKRLAKGLEFNTSYTWSKALDTESLNTLASSMVLQDSTNINGDRGLSDFDARHRFTFSGIYDLPFQGSRWKSGYEFAAVAQLQSGNPVDLITSATFTGLATVRPSILTNNIPVGYGTSAANGNIQYIPDAACATVQPGCIFLASPNQFGDLGRNVIIGPGFEDVDLSFLKDTKIAERFTLQFRADAFNLFNHPNFGQPNRIVSTAAGNTFGQITSTRFPVGDSGSSRQLQLALRLLF